MDSIALRPTENHLAGEWIDTVEGIRADLEHTYPHGEMHGGGPPALDCLAPEEVSARYPLVTLRDTD
jgi:hypothetical protein